MPSLARGWAHNLVLVGEAGLGAAAPRDVGQTQGRGAGTTPEAEAVSGFAAPSTATLGFSIQGSQAAPSPTLRGSETGMLLSPLYFCWEMSHHRPDQVSPLCARGHQRWGCGRDPAPASPSPSPRPLGWSCLWDQPRSSGKGGFSLRHWGSIEVERGRWSLSLPGISL